MSIVRYVNKKTGTVALYESTSHYDPVTKQSRPIRKYLGTEDPETGELVPSSGKRGRKKGQSGGQNAKGGGPAEDIRAKYGALVQECGSKDERIRQLEHENRRLRFCIQKLRDTASDMLGGAGI